MPLSNSKSRLIYRLQELEKEIEKQKGEKIKIEKEKKEKLSTAQQLLVLHYLGFLDKLDMSTKAKSILVSKIIDKSFDNIKKELPNLYSPRLSDSNIKKVPNLEVVLKLFNDLKMTEVADKVKVDLNKIKKI